MTLRRFLRECSERFTRGIVYLRPSIRATVFSFAGSTGWSLLNWRFCFGDLFMSLPDIWARRMSFPVPVTLNLFFAPECVFCFGIFFDSCVLRWAEHHRHVPPFEERLRLDHTNVLDVLSEAHQQVAPTIRMLALAAPEHDRHLDLRALVQEARDVAFLGVVVVNSDLRPELDLLDVDLRLVLAGNLRLLLQLVPVLPVVHHPGHRRIGLRGDLHAVGPLVEGVLHRLFRGLDPELRPVVVDQPDLRRADVVVDPCLRSWPRRRFDRAPRPQRAITKLDSILSVKQQSRCTQRPKILVLTTRLNHAELKLAR